MSSIQVVKSNIAELHVDFVVNAANEGLRAGSGVCGAIFDAAGSAQLQAACDKLGGCAVGDVVVTPGFALPAKYIIHAVGPRWNGGRSGEEKQLRSCYRKSLEIVREYGGHSIAFPVISSGIFGYPKEEAWKAAISTVRDDLARNCDYDIAVTFAVNGRSSLELGNRILAEER